MDTGQNAPILQGLAKILVLENLIEEETAQDALIQSVKKNVPFVLYLAENKILTAPLIAFQGSKDFGVPLLNIEDFDLEHLPLELVSEKLIKRHHALPLYKRGNHLFLAIADPSKQLALDEIKFHTGLQTHCVLTEADKLYNVIEQALSARESAVLGDYLDDTALDDLDITSGEEEHKDDGSDGTDDAPIVRFVNKILLDAIKQGASDVHFEPFENSYRIRFRVDGMLMEMANPPPNLANRIASRLKVMSQLDISERRVPQDGRFKMKLSKKNSIDFRVNTCPTIGGEKVVMRILDPTSVTLGMDALGFDPKQKEDFLKAIHQPQGMVLVTGPTGSGKTVTLYTALHILNVMEKNISTVEDPVEIKVSGINQVNINLKSGLDFPSALRSFLRQDPDIIMVGEIRDIDAGEIGIKAAQTGHLVLSTLHTNSAAETLTRLVNMGIAPFNIASSVSLIIAQRLGRRLCEYCKKVENIPAASLIDLGFKEEEVNDLEIYGPVGCEHCTKGYKGRIGLYEVMPISDDIGEIIMRGGTSLDVLKQAKAENFLTIRDSGIAKVKAGITSLEELGRVTKE